MRVPQVAAFAGAACVLRPNQDLHRGSWPNSLSRSTDFNESLSDGQQVDGRRCVLVPRRHSRAKWWSAAQFLRRPAETCLESKELRHAVETRSANDEPLIPSSYSLKGQRPDHHGAFGRGARIDACPRTNPSPRGCGRAILMSSSVRRISWARGGCSARPWRQVSCRR